MAEAQVQESVQVKGMPEEVFRALSEHFPGEIKPARYEGALVPAKRIVEVIRFLRDEMGYSFLSNLTATDYYEVKGVEPHIDVVYHLFRMQGGYAALHVEIPRELEKAHLLSVTSLFPSAMLQEREVYDMFGVKFDGHPDLRRLLMWEGFDGYPLRKDWKEVYYEGETKPYRSRYPKGGHPIYAEELSPLKDNIRYPEGWSPQAWDYDEADRLLYERMLSAHRDPDKPLKTDEMIINFGPHHPSTHGVFRMAVRLDGETVRHLEPVFGYLHRNHEKIGERNTWIQNIPFTDRLDYINGMTNNWAYVIALEKLLGWEVPERAEYIRVIVGEFSRIVNHMLAAGFFSNELGLYFTGSLYALEEREHILDLFEALSGARMMFNYMRPGGVRYDLPEGWLEKAKALAYERIPRKVEQMQHFLLDNDVVKARTMGVGVLPPDVAMASGITGPVLRASGVAYDIRRAEPYSLYDQLDFEVAVRTHGDAYDRLAIRFDEIWQSLRILRQVLENIPEGPIVAKKPSHRLKVPEGETYGRIEAPKGELGFYLVSLGKFNPYRYHIRSTSLLNLTALSDMTRGLKVADIVTVLGSIDLTMGEVDR